jgi:hypothetical protein
MQTAPLAAFPAAVSAPHLAAIADIQAELIRAARAYADVMADRPGPLCRAQFVGMAVEAMNGVLAARQGSAQQARQPFSLLPSTDDGTNRKGAAPLSQPAGILPTGNGEE